MSEMNLRVDLEALDQSAGRVAVVVADLERVCDSLATHLRDAGECVEVGELARTVHEVADVTTDTGRRLRSMLAGVGHASTGAAEAYARTDRTLAERMAE